MDSNIWCLMKKTNSCRRFLIKWHNLSEEIVFYIKFFGLRCMSGWMLMMAFVILYINISFQCSRHCFSSCHLSSLIRLEGPCLCCSQHWHIYQLFLYDLYLLYILFHVVWMMNSYSEQKTHYRVMRSQGHLNYQIRKKY